MTKRETLIAALSDWIAVNDLMKMLDWQPHTVRGALSGIGKTHKVERRRVDGITSYRIAPDTPKSDLAIPESLRRTNQTPA